MTDEEGKALEAIVSLYIKCIIPAEDTLVYCLLQYVFCTNISAGYLRKRIEKSWPSGNNKFSNFDKRGEQKFNKEGFS